MVGLIIIGAVMVLFPKAIYVLTESWKNDGTESPSDTYILITRIGGGIFLAVGLLNLFG